MKTTNLTKWLALGLWLIGSAVLQAETIFEANFDDSPPYLSGTRLPMGLGKIPYGKWYSDQLEGFSFLVSEEKSLSEPFSLMMENTGVPLESGQHANVWGSFGAESSLAMVFSCAFLLTRVDGGAGADFVTMSIHGSPGGKALTTVQIGVGGEVVVRDGATLNAVGKIEAERWYFLEITMPEAKQSGTRSVVTLYEAKGKERGASLGSAEGPAPQAEANYDYTGFSLFNGLTNSKIFFDDFLAVVQN